MNIRNKINEKINYIQVIQDLGSRAQTFVLIHKSYVNKIPKNNATYLDQNQDLGMYTR